MGRPIKSKYFGAQKGQATGGEGVVSTITVTNTGTAYSQGAVAVFSAPQIPGGTTAAGTLTIGTPTTQGRITAVSLTNAGAGYTSTATVSITTASSVSKTASGTSTQTTLHLNNVTGIYVGMTVTGSTGLGNGNAPFVTAVDSATNSVTVSAANDGAISAATLTFADYGSGFAAVTSLTTSVSNVIKGRAYLSTGTAQSLCDIDEQVASKKYRVQNSEGVGTVRLVTTATLAAGQMNIEATDTNGSKYYVKKLTARRAVIVQTTATGSFVFDNNDSVGWSLTAAGTGVVLIENN